LIQQSNKYLSKREKILVIIFAIGFVGIYFSKTILSFFPYILILYGLFSNGGISRLKSLTKRPEIISFLLIFIVYTLSGINSNNIPQWLGRLNTNLLYISIPLGIYLNGSFKKKTSDYILSTFVIINAMISFGLVLIYLGNIDNTNEVYLRGQTIYTPIMHVRYSFFVAMSIIISAYLTYNYSHTKKLKYIYGSITLFSLFFLHLLAVRTGLLSFYITFISVVFYYTFKHKKYLIGFGSIVSIVLLLISSYLFLPSVRNKVRYIKWDIETTLNNTAKYHTSDRIRILSIVNGLKLIKENPLVGTGIGDIEEEMNKKYKINYPDLPQNMRFEPINHLVFIASTMGMIGFILFYGLLLFPIFYLKDKHALLIPIYILTFASFIGENIIELMIGKSAFLIIVLLLICTTINKNKKTT